MKQLMILALLISLLVPGVALAQTLTPEQLLAQANQAQQNASGLQGTANGLRSQAAGLDQQALAEINRSNELKQQAIQLQANLDAIRVAAQSQQAAEHARTLYAQAAQLNMQANLLDVQALQQWQIFYANVVQAMSASMLMVQSSTLIASRESLNAAQYAGQVYEQGHTIVALNNQVNTLYRFLAGVGLLALALVMAIVWLVIRYSQRAMNQLAMAFAQAAKQEDTAIVRDNNVKTYQVLSGVADGTGN